jgi:hypothetical protein
VLTGEHPDYAYAAALTDIVGQVELLERLIKGIVGEMALDMPDWNASRHSSMSGF